MATQFSGSLNLTGSLQISGSINDIYYVDFDQKDSPTAVARLAWDSSEGTLTVGLSGGNLDMPIGVVSFEIAYNEDSSSISKGDVVRVSGAQGNRVAIKKANNLGDAGSAATLALAAETIGVGAEGKVITKGPLKGINTTAFNEGDMLYLSSTPGGITNIKPQAPFHDVRLGVAQRIHASIGIINIQVQNGYELDEIHDVRITTASLANKQLLAYSGSVWANQTISELGIAETASLNSHTASVNNINAGLMTYTASLKSAAIVSSSTQIANYNLFALTASANTFYGTQTLTNNLQVDGRIGIEVPNPDTNTKLHIADTTNGFVGIRLSGSGAYTGTDWTLYASTNLAPSSNDFFGIYNNSTTDGATAEYKFKVHKAGDVTITNGNLEIGTAGKGIDFSITTNGSGTMSSELLNDYEEGTWTATATYSGTNTPTHAYQTGHYTKIGRVVHIQALVSWNENGSTGNLTITGLPFTSNSTVARAPASLMNFGFNGITTNLVGEVENNTTYIKIRKPDNSGTLVTDTDTDNDQDLYINCTYMV